MNKHERFLLEELEEGHFSATYHTPLRADAFKLSDEEKIHRIEGYFRQIMETLGLDMSDDSLQNTPRRVAKMYIKEIFGGLHPDAKPKTSTFQNKYKYNQMLVEKNIAMYSTCEHHFLPVVGRAHVGYISNGKVIGLSKINRIVDHFARRPQVQERLTIQIVQALKEILDTQDVACVIDAKHLCVNSRGIRDFESSTATAELGGIFKIDRATREEFLHHIGVSTRWNV
ncbi:MAG: GTP cyclohydrolase I FolE [Flavobacteriales bacterium AspAUS03]